MSILSLQRISSKEKWNVFLFIVVLLIFFRITNLFNFSSNPFWRLFTDFKVIYSVFLISLIGSALKGKKVVWRNRGSTLLVFILISVFVSNFLSPEVESRYNQLVTFSCYLMLYFLIVRGFNSWQVETFIKFIPIGTVILLILDKFISMPGIISYFAWTDKFQNYMIELVEVETWFKGLSGLTKRSSCLWLDANNWAYYLSLSITVIFYYLLKCNKFWKRLLYLALFFVLAAILFATYSRGGFLATLFSLFYLILFSKVRSSRKVVTSLIIVVCTLFSGMFSVFDNLKGLFDRIMLAMGMLGIGYGENYYGGLEEFRMLTLIKAWKVFLERPILGWGNITIGIHGTGGNHMHYLNILGQLGIIGACLHIVFYYYIFNSLRKIRKQFEITRKNDGLSYLLMAILIVFMIKGFFAPLFYDYWIYASVIIAYSLQMNKKSTNNNS